MLFDGFTAFHDQWRHIGVVPGHLFPKIDTEGRLPLVNPIWAVVGGLHTLQVGRQWR